MIQWLALCSGVQTSHTLGAHSSVMIKPPISAQDHAALQRLLNNAPSELEGNAKEIVCFHYLILLQTMERLNVTSEGKLMDENFSVWNTAMLKLLLAHD